MKHSTTRFTILLFFACLAEQFCHADDPVTPVTTIEKFNLATGGTGLYRPGKWGLIRVSLRNPQDQDAEVLATTYFVRNETLQFGRRMWLPPKSRMIAWHPIKMPEVDEPGQQTFDLRSMVLSRSSGGESMAVNEMGAMQFDQGFRIAADEPVTAMILNPLESKSAGPLWADPQDLVLTARLDRGFHKNFTILGDALMPAGEETLDALDHLIIAGDRIRPDAAGIGAIRRWVASGGRLWIMADRISPELLAALMGDEDNIMEVDRVDLTSVNIETGTWSAGSISFERDLEVPVRFVRVIAQHLDVDFLVNGWPAALRKPYGSGLILITTLGTDGWLRPRTPSDPTPPGKGNMATAFFPSGPLSHLAMEFFIPRSPSPIPRELAEEEVRQMIGYTIPSRTLVLGTLTGFTGLMIVGAIMLARRGRLELMGLFVPGLAIAAAGLLLGAGWNSRSTVPTSTAVIQTVQAIPGTDDIRSSGLAGLFSKDSLSSKDSLGQPSSLTGTSHTIPLSGEQGGWMMPEMAGLEGTNRRLVWTDIDKWSWDNISSKPGLRMVAFQTAGRVDQPVEAVAQFDPLGISGKLVLPAGLEPADAVISTSRGRMGVQIHADGKFTSSASAVLGTDEYLSAHVLSDEQQRRSRILSRMLGPGTTPLAAPVLYVWTKPWDVGTSQIHESRTVGSALVSIQLRWERPESGTSIMIPAPFLPMREATGPDGTRPSGLFDVRTGKWVERTGSVSGWLAFTVPGNLLPLKVKSASLTFKVLGPMGRLELSTAAGKRRQSQKVWENPVGTLTHLIIDPAALALDSRGRLLVCLDVGHQDAKSDTSTDSATKGKIGVSDPASYWQFEEASLQLSAEIPNLTTSTQP